MKSLRWFFWFTDIAFVCYWLITALKWIPEQYLYLDYKNPILYAWNWSFFPLDLFISLTGFYSLRFMHKGDNAWQRWALVSLVLTFCSGLQAVAYWTVRLEFDLQWWIPNLYLLIYPLFYIPRLLRSATY
ncbi:DUF5360 family protein [Cohnella soli]|uniref:DUF5360 family protein n=1 Tax=Cohnella soli TaxID=425005 RepID=A0ABW0HQ92_9BACL